MSVDSALASMVKSAAARRVIAVQPMLRTRPEALPLRSSPPASQWRFRSEGVDDNAPGVIANGSGGAETVLRS